MSKYIQWGRISSGISNVEVYQVGKNIKWGRISSWKDIKLGIISSVKVYPVGKNIKWGRLPSGEENQVGMNKKLGRISS